MPRKSVSPATQKEATAAESKTEQEVAPRRSARAAAKRDASPVSLEGGRARRSSTAAQTAASVAESRVTRSRSRSTRRGSTSSDSRSKSAKEISLESPAPRARSSRRSASRINYKESDGEEDVSTSKGGSTVVTGNEDVEEDYNADYDVEASDSEGSNRVKAKATVKSPVKSRQPKSRNRTPKQQARTKGRTPKSKDEEEEEEEEEPMETESDIKEANDESKEQPAEDSTDRPSRRRSNRGDNSANAEKKVPVSGGRRSSGRVKTETSTPEAKPSRRATKASSEVTESSTRPQRTRGRQTKVEVSIEKPEEDKDQDITEKEPQNIEIEESTPEPTKKRKAEESADDIQDENTKKLKVESTDSADQLMESETTKVISDLTKSESKEDIITEDVVQPVTVSSSEVEEKLPSDSDSPKQPLETQSTEPEQTEEKEIEEVKESEPSSEEQMEIDSEPPSAELPPSNLNNTGANQRHPVECSSAVEEEKNVNEDEVKPECLPVESTDAEKDDEEMEDIQSDDELEEKEKSEVETIDAAPLQPDHSHESSKESEVSKDITPAQHTDQSDLVQESKDLLETLEEDEDVYEECREEFQQPSEQSKSETGTANLEADELQQLPETQQSTEDSPKDKSLDKIEEKHEDSVIDGIFQDSLPKDELLTSDKTPESIVQPKPFSLNGENLNEKIPASYSSHSPPRSDKPDINQDASSTSEENLVPKANGAHDIEDLSETFTPNRNYVINPNFNNDARESLKDKIFGFVSYNLGATIKDDISHNEKFLAELRRLQADIICLQEVKESFLNEVLEPSLDVLGYKSVVSIPEGRAAGLATFIKNSSFQMTSHCGASLQSLIDKDLQASSLEFEDKKAVHSFLQKCGHVLFTQLSSVNENQTVMVANVLLPPSDISTHALQMSCLAREVLTRMEGSVKPILLCGAFNMAEGEAAYQLLRDGYLSNEMIEELQKRKDIVLFGKENEALINVLWNAFQHPSSNLCSCYSTVLGHELRLPGDQATTSPDLLWFSSDCLKTIGVLDVLSTASGNQNSEGNHFTLKADIAFSI